jgi:hypothetical protein
VETRPRLKQIGLRISRFECLDALAGKDLEPANPTRQQHFTISRHASPVCFARRSPLLEIALVFMRVDHVASFVVNANHGIMHSEYQISGHVANIAKVAAT